MVGLVFGIPYEHVLGHRGLTHSIAFAMLLGIVIPKVAVPAVPCWSALYGKMAIYFGLVTKTNVEAPPFGRGGNVQPAAAAGHGCDCLCACQLKE